MANPETRSTRSSASQHRPARKTYKERASEKLAAVSPGWNHAWTERERIVLRHLNELIPSKPSHRTAVFNAIFKDEHAAAGFPGGRDRASLRSQWSDRTRPNRALWDKIKSGPRGRTEEREWATLEREVRKVAGAKGVPVLERARDYHSGEVSDDGENEEPSGKRNNEKLRQQAVGRSRKGGKFAKEKKVKARASEVEVQQAVEDGMDVDEEGEQQDIAPHAQPKLNDINDNEVTEHEGTLNDQDNHATFTAPPLLIPPLLMIHTSQIEWASTDAFWSPDENLTPVPTTSAIYALSGKVHRVTDINSQQHDYILCNPSFCSTCSTTSKDPATAKSPTNGLPFIHAKDVQRIDGKWTFTPSRGEGFDRQNTEYTESYRRNVIFGDGVMRIVAVCTYAKCKVCREHTIVQRKKGVYNGEPMET